MKINLVTYKLYLDYLSIFYDIRMCLPNFSHKYPLRKTFSAIQNPDIESVLN